MAKTRKKTTDEAAAPAAEMTDRQPSANGGAPAQADGADGADGGEWVRRRAYELYLDRGDAPGDDLNDWLRAEREYRERPDAQQSR